MIIVANDLTQLTATDCFDYFVNHFETLYKNESKYRNLAVLDPDITNIELYESLKEHFLLDVLNNPEFKDYQVDFERGIDGGDNFIMVAFTDPTDESVVTVEINRDETSESVLNSFNKGIETLRSTFAPEVYEMKTENHA